MCQHPNIVKLVDLFENADYYYIVLEYMAGNDLFDYLQHRNFKLGESRAREVAMQIGKAVAYLHNYGIVHRDLKLENIMMSDNSEKSIPKLVDFGLSKIIGPSEMTTEPFGTLGYVAPEVIKKQPYTFSCDIWSLGCILHSLISGVLPFDDENNSEIAKMTIASPLVFELPCWRSTSHEIKDLLLGLLQKDPPNRLTLEDFFNHKWFRM